jgi:hypothetical protein
MFSRPPVLSCITSFLWEIGSAATAPLAPLVSEPPDWEYLTLSHSSNHVRFRIKSAEAPELAQRVVVERGVGFAFCLIRFSTRRRTRRS